MSGITKIKMHKSSRNEYIVEKADFDNGSGLFIQASVDHGFGNAVRIVEAFLEVAEKEKFLELYRKKEITIEDMNTAVKIQTKELFVNSQIYSMFFKKKVIY